MKKQFSVLPAYAVSAAMMGLFASSVLLTSCGKEEKKVELMSEGDNNSGPDRQKKIDSLSEGYQTSFVIAKGDDDYQSEYLINRGMRFFQRNFDAYKEKLKNCSQILLTTRGASHWEHPTKYDPKTGQTVPSGKMVLHINVAEQELNWRRLVENFEDYDIAAQRLTDLEKQLRNELNFEDKLGLNSTEMTAFAQAMSEAAKGLDFNSLPPHARLVHIDSKAGFAPAFLLVEPGREVEYYRDYLVQVIELHRHLRKDIDEISLKTGKNVVLKDGVMVPAEIMRGLTMLEGNAKLFQDSNRQFDTIMLGRRFEESKDRIKQLNTFLVPFDATQKQIEEGLARFDSNWSKLAKLAVQDAKNHYKMKAINLDVSPSAYTSEAGLNKFKRALEQLMAVATAQKLNSVGVWSISQSGGAASISGSTLFIDVMDFRAADVDAEIARVLSQKDTAERLQTQRTVLQSLNNAFSGSSVSVSWTDGELQPTIATATLQLSRFVDVFKRRAHAARLKECKTSRVVIVRSSLAQEQVVFAGDEVRVNPYAMEESVLEDRIIERIKSLQPLPVPSPSPSPVPSPAQSPAPKPPGTPAKSETKRN